MLRPIAKIAAGSLVLALASLVATVARGGDDVDAAIKVLTRLDQRVHIMALEFNEAPGEGADAADRRVVDAEGLLGLGRPDQAMTLLLDVLARWPGTLAARDARFLLADALFSTGDLLSARLTYDAALAAPPFSGTRREQRAVVRLIEIALRTGDFEHIDRYLGLLAQVEGAALDPSVAYVKGKVLYFRGDLDAAAAAFASIAPGSAFHWRARYFVATILVKRGDLVGAAGAYEALLHLAAPDAGAQEIQDLARLALGRISYQLGDPQRATAYYQSIPAGSKSLPDGLFELGWTHVRAKDFPKATDAFARLLRLQPSGPQAPELKLLLANLRLRRGDFGVARRAFSDARDELEPTYRNLQAVIIRSQDDPLFAEQLNRQSLDQIDLAVFVPASAREWVRADPEIERLLTLASDVVGSQQGVADAGTTLGAIQDVLANADRVMMFPELGRVRRRSTETLAALVQIRGQFLGRARRLEQPHLQATEEQFLDRDVAEWASIEEQIADRLATNVPFGQDPPQTGNSVGVGDGDGKPASTSPSSPSGERPAADIGQLRAAVLQLVGPLSSDRNGIAEAQRAARSAAISATRASALDKRLQQITAAEAQVQRQVLARMNAVPHKELDRQLEVVARVDAAVSQLFSLDARVAAEADVRVAALQRLVADRGQDVAALDRKLTTVVAEAQNLGGNLTRLMYTRVANRLYDLIVRADVGLIDVAWAVKDRSTGTLTAKLNEMNRELSLAAEALAGQEAAMARRFKVETEWARRTIPIVLPELH